MKDLIPSIIKYITSLPTVKLISHSIIAIIFLFMVGMIYVISTNFIYLYDNFLINNENINIEESVRNTIAINTLATEVMNSLDASRVMLLKFHNGVTTVNGIPFIFASATNEVTNNGITEVLTDFQKIPINTTLELVNNMITNTCYSLKVNSTNSLGFDNLLKEAGVDYAFGCPVIDSQNNLIGYLLVQFNYTRSYLEDPEYEEIIYNEMLRIIKGIQRYV